MLQTARLRRERVAAAALFADPIASSVRDQLGTIACNDPQVLYAVRRDLTEHRRSFAPGQDTFGHNSPYASLGIGVSLVVAPLYLLQQALDAPSPLIIPLIIPLLLTVVGLAPHRCGRLLGSARHFSVLVSPCFSLLTMAPQANTELSPEPRVALAIALRRRRS